jgi:hypothetical protein
MSSALALAARVSALATAAAWVMRDAQSDFATTHAATPPATSPAANQPTDAIPSIMIPPAETTLTDL